MNTDPNEQVIPDSERGGSDKQGTLFPTLNDWVEHFLILVYNRAQGSGRSWCQEWWRHDEAVYRLDTLWRSWEYLRVNDPTGPATWLVNYADPIMTILTQADGCFKGCDHDNHRAYELNPDEKLPTHTQPDALLLDRY